jgi:hypothetical protein
VTVIPPKPAESIEELFKALEAAKAEQERQEKVQAETVKQIAARIKAEKSRLLEQVKRLEEMEKRLEPFVEPSSRCGADKGNLREQQGGPPGRATDLPGGFASSRPVGTR